MQSVFIPEEDCSMDILDLIEHEHLLKYASFLTLQLTLYHLDMHFEPFVVS
ncbi:hypothetical protein DPMN_097577 [Dreissena polymorpha]|uniref:Uncharacterized protein n=1 Tax=Dreissena polymorpha TaxID=45954 RepID=A0A9D4R5V2_DREPO|nr:hypothetical protein DPMN_097577 [Dreissena polymorpha]